MSPRDAVNHVFLYDFARHAETQLTHDALPDQSPHFSPDGKSLAFIRGAGKFRASDGNAGMEDGVLPLPGHIGVRDGVLPVGHHHADFGSEMLLVVAERLGVFPREVYIGCQLDGRVPDNCSGGGTLHVTPDALGLPPNGS